MKKYLLWLTFILLCIFVLPNIINHAIMINSVNDISETPLVNGEYNE